MKNDFDKAVLQMYWWISKSFQIIIGKKCEGHWNPVEIVSLQILYIGTKKIIFSRSLSKQIDLHINLDAKINLNRSLHQQLRNFNDVEF